MVQIQGSSKSIRYTKVEIVRMKSCFLHVVLLNDLHLARKVRSRSSSARPAMPFVNQERLVLKFPIVYIDVDNR